jgi:hypothetical protein
MAKFLVTYHGGEMPAEPELREQARSEFVAWLSRAGGAVLDPGAAVRAVTQLSAGEPEPLSEIGGYSLIQADSVEEASGILTSHPFVHRGGTLQLNEILEL